MAEQIKVPDTRFAAGQMRLEAIGFDTSARLYGRIEFPGSSRHNKPPQRWRWWLQQWDARTNPEWPRWCRTVCREPGAL